MWEGLLRGWRFNDLPARTCGCCRETLSNETMNTALDLHNKLARHLLHLHHGHEALTEGDSFTVAFESPWDALAFAQVRPALRGAGAKRLRASPVMTCCAPGGVPAGAAEGAARRGLAGGAAERHRRRSRLGPGEALPRSGSASRTARP